MINVDPTLLNSASSMVKNNNVVWDVGANLGFFTFTSSLLVGENGMVVAFEPDTWLVRALRESVKKQRYSTNITIVPTAVAKENALRTFAIAKRARASNHLVEYGHSQAGGMRDSETVPCISLDWALNFYSAPNVLKIDVEGAEYEVLLGASELIKKYRPSIIIEVGYDNTKNVGDFLRLNEYEIYDGDKDPQFLNPLNKPTWTTIAIPKLSFFSLA